MPSERVVSRHVAELIAASMPKYKPIQARPETVAPIDQEIEKPSSEIVQLPRYLVSGSKLPAPMEVLTKKGLEHYAMDHYIGPEDGLDRGLLNHFTIAGLWKKIPVLGYFRFVSSETNEERAMRLYNNGELKRKMDELKELMNLPNEVGDVPGTKK